MKVVSIQYFRCLATSALALAILAAAFQVRAQDAQESTADSNPIARIRDEGMNHSQVMDTLSYLSDVIGGRLTGSPNMKRANEWTKEKLLSWGLTNGQLEAWGPFGRGWELRRFSLQVVEPQTVPLKAFPSAWSTGFDKPFEANVVYLKARTDADLEEYRGKIKGAVVLASPIREVPLHVDPLVRRFNESNLLTMANASPPVGAGGGFNVLSGAVDGLRGAAPPSRRGGPGAAAAAGTNAAPRRGVRAGGGGARFLPFLANEGAAMILNPSSSGDGGTFTVQSATVPASTNTVVSTNSSDAPRGAGAGRSAYSLDAPDYPAQVTVAAEDYNRLVRMVDAGEKLKMAVDLQVKFYTNDPMAYNTTAEIPGADLKDEIVMLGGHMDSWHSGSGATDNGAGVAAAMEAVRIIKALHLKPRRTIRIALWSGEEQGLLGSRAYVSQHFGYFTNETSGASNGNGSRGGGSRKLVKGDEYEKLSVYFNLDNGGGKIRGIFMQGNEAVRPLFRRWLDPFRDLGAETLTPLSTGSTDHISFDNIGLPGFQFIQDSLDYASRTHHTNEDVFDRIQADDMKQASTILAAFVYQAAMLDDRLPRKGVE